MSRTTLWWIAGGLLALAFWYYMRCNRDDQVSTNETKTWLPYVPSNGRVNVHV